MDEYNISKIIKEFTSFQKEIKNDLSNKQFTKLSNYKECYLIKEDWYNEFSDIIKNSEKNSLLKKFLSDKKPEFINDIDSLIKNLKNNNEFKIISNNFIKILFNSKINLNNNNRVHYYSGNNRFIVEYMNI